MKLGCHSPLFCGFAALLAVSLWLTVHIDTESEATPQSESRRQSLTKKAVSQRLTSKDAAEPPKKLKSEVKR